MELTPARTAGPPPVQLAREGVRRRHLGPHHPHDDQLETARLHDRRRPLVAEAHLVDVGDLHLGAAATAHGRRRLLSHQTAVLLHDLLDLGAARQHGRGQGSGPHRVTAGVVHPALAQHRVVHVPDEELIGTVERRRPVGHRHVQHRSVAGLQQERLHADLAGRVVEPVGADLADVRLPRHPRPGGQPAAQQLELGRTQRGVVQQGHGANLRRGPAHPGPHFDTSCKPPIFGQQLSTSSSPIGTGCLIADLRCRHGHPARRNRGCGAGRRHDGARSAGPEARASAAGCRLRTRPRAPAHPTAAAGPAHRGDRARRLPAGAHLPLPPAAHLVRPLRGLSSRLRPGARGGVSSPRRRPPARCAPSRPRARRASGNVSRRSSASPGSASTTPPELRPAQTRKLRTRATPVTRRIATSSGANSCRTGGCCDLGGRSRLACASRSSIRSSTKLW